MQDFIYSIVVVLEIFRKNMIWVSRIPKFAQVSDLNPPCMPGGAVDIGPPNHQTTRPLRSQADRWEPAGTCSKNILL